MCIRVQEAAIEEYFKPLDKQAEAIVKMQLDGEESMKDMMETMHKQALLEKLEAEGISSMQKAGTSHQHNQDCSSATTETEMR